MTNKTPIDKAAEDIRKRYERFLYPEDEPEIADIIRRRLEKEVPMRDEEKEVANHGAAPGGHNDCRRAIGLRDDTEEA